MKSTGLTSRKSRITAICVAILSVTCGGSLGFVAFGNLTDHSPGQTVGDWVWGLTAAYTSLCLFMGGVATCVTIALSDSVSRFFGLLAFVGAIVTGGWGISAAFDLLCVRQHATGDSAGLAVLGARVSIAVSALCVWIGVMGILNLIALHGTANEVDGIASHREHRDAPDA